MKRDFGIEIEERVLVNEDEVTKEGMQAQLGLLARKRGWARRDSYERARWNAH